MSRLSSAIHMTCPRCRMGEMFIRPLQITRPLRMHKRCSVCGQPFEPEIGFYYGAMFISYLFIAFISLLSVGISVFVFKFPVEISFLILILFLAIIFVWNLKFSRSLWIHIIVKYDPSYKPIAAKEN